MFSGIKNAVVMLLAAFSLSGCLTVVAVEAPERSAQFPGKYLACDERSRTRAAVRQLGVNQLSPSGIEAARSSGSVIDGCRVGTVSSEAFIRRAGYEVTADGWRVPLFKIDQFGWEYVIADRRNALFVGN